MRSNSATCGPASPRPNASRRHWYDCRPARIDVDAEDLPGLVCGDLLDVHAARRGGDEGDAAALTVEEHAEIKLALDRASGFHVDEVDRQTPGARLRRHESLAKHGSCRLADFLGGPAKLDAARLAATARVYLRLDHPDRARQRARRGNGFRLVRGDPAFRHRHAVVGEDSLRLVFVKIHHDIVPADLNRVANTGRIAGPPWHAC